MKKNENIEMKNLGAMEKIAGAVVNDVMVLVLQESKLNRNHYACHAILCSSSRGALSYSYNS